MRGCRGRWAEPPRVPCKPTPTLFSTSRVTSRLTARPVTVGPGRFSQAVCGPGPRPCELGTDPGRQAAGRWKGSPHGPLFSVPLEDFLRAALGVWPASLQGEGRVSPFLWVDGFFLAGSLWVCLLALVWTEGRYLTTENIIVQEPRS